MTLTQYLDAIAEKMGISGLKDRLLSTYLEAFAQKEGVNTAELPDATVTTYLRAILEKRGAELPEGNTLVALLSALAKSHGVATVPDNLVGTFLGAIAGNAADDGDLFDITKNPVVQGSISSSTGGESSSTTRLRIAGFIKVQPNTAYTFSSNLARLFVIEYATETDKPCENSGWKDAPFTYTTTADTKYIRLTLAHATNSTIVVDDFEWLKIIPA